MSENPSKPIISTLVVKVALDGINCKLRIPDSCLQELILKHTWKGEVEIEHLTADRTQVIAQHAKKQHVVTVERASIEERKIIRAWNRSTYVQAQERATERDSRNYPVPFKKIAELLPLVRKAMKIVGVADIIRHTESYLDFCSTGAHIWEGQSHGFKSLSGLLEKLIALKKSGAQPWWDTRCTPERVVNDDNAKLTSRVANSFAQTFMNEEKFPLIEGNKEHVNFKKCAQQIVNFINRKQRQGIVLVEGDVIKYLLEFVESLFDREGDRIFPAHLASEAVWTSLSQYLKEKGVI